MLVADNLVIEIDYTLRSASGEVLDTSEGQAPLAYLHGHQQIVPGLERALAGLGVGESKDVVVPPEEGYGVADPEEIFAVPRAAFPEGVTLEAGETFVGEDDQGQSLPVRIIEVREDEVVVDANHPLAGETLHFHVDVRGVREATAEELEHGHVHEGDEHEHEHGADDQA